jgi:hypothetical protein
MMAPIKLGHALYVQVERPGKHDGFKYFSVTLSAYLQISPIKTFGSVYKYP